MGLYNVDCILVLHELHERVEVGLGGEQFVQGESGGAG